MLIHELESWYLKHRRDLPFREQSNPYWIWVSEIMLQQTQMDTVIPYFLKFIDRFPTIQELAKSSEQEVLSLVQGLGYYRRFRLLKQAADEIVKQYQGIFPNRYEDIIQLPGIGDYTAGAIASIAFNLPKSAVDGNVLRVVSRFKGMHEDISLSSTKKKINELNQSWIEKAHPRIYTQALMELGALVCRPVHPRCNQCPLKDQCSAHRDSLTTLLPRVSKKKRQSIETMTTVIFLYKNKIGFEKRSDGLLEGMYLFPQWNDQSIEHVLEKLDMVNTQSDFLGHMTHVFTHKRWEMDVYLVRVQKPSILNVDWYDSHSIKTIPIPQAHRKIMEALATKILFEKS